MEEFHGTKSTLFNQENSSNSALLGQVVLNDFILKYTEGLDFSEEKLKTILSQFEKSTVTLKTIDFIIFCYIFGFVSEKEAKSYRALVKVNPDLSKLMELIKFEFSSFGLSPVTDHHEVFEENTNFMDSFYS